MDIITIGSACNDIVLKPIPNTLLEQSAGVRIPEIVSTTGGDALNTALDCVKLGMSAGLIAKVGDDQYAEVIHEHLEKRGVDHSQVMTDPHAETSLSFVCLEPSGEKHVVHTCGANDELGYDDVDFDYVAKAKFIQYGSANVHKKLDGEGIAKVFRRAKELGLTTSMDVNCNLPPEECYNNIKDVLNYTDIFFPSDYEAEIITNGLKTCEEYEEFFSHYGLKILVVKLGAKGVFVTDFKTRRYLSTFHVDEVLDTTGCGDAFVAAFLTGLSKGWSIWEAAVLGNAVGSMNCQAIGANMGVGTFEETMAYIKERIQEVPEDLRARFQ